MKKIGWIVSCLFLLIPLLSCAHGLRDRPSPPPPTEQTPEGVPEGIPERIRITSFNMKTFGAAKMARPGVRAVLADIAAHTDICAIQEVRSRSIAPMEEFMALLPPRFAHILGEREGRSGGYQEQYWIIYDSEKLSPLGIETYPDPGDVFAREPLGVYFRTGDRFDFILLDNHITPSDAAAEIAALPEAAAWFRDHWEEADLIVLGDFNADGSYFNENRLEEMFPPGDWIMLITNDLDTTVAPSDNTYDRIIISSSVREDYTGARGVLRFDEVYDLDMAPSTVSDHYPVWAEFFIEYDTD